MIERPGISVDYGSTWLFQVLYAGTGIDGSFKGIASGSIQQQFYIVFDHNNEFADLGMRGSASGGLAGGMIGAEFGYDFAMNGGFNAQGEVKSDWIIRIMM